MHLGCIVIRQSVALSSCGGHGILDIKKRTIPLYKRVGQILSIFEFGDILSMKIALKEITEQNKQECFALSVSPAQSEYIASNENSLKEAQENPEVARPFAIYADDKMIGVTMFAWDENNEDPEDKYWLWRFMIDKSLQGKGYGHLALKEIIQYFKDNGADIITLSTKESNKKALSLYHQFGFKENGEMNDEEIVLKLYL